MQRSAAVFGSSEIAPVGSGVSRNAEPIATLPAVGVVDFPA